MRPAQRFRIESDTDPQPSDWECDHCGEYLDPDGECPECDHEQDDQG